jgi:DNA-binding winged helix-turn-helix (wHTH) protein
VDTHRHALTRDGGPIDLSPRDVEILAHLLSHPDKVIATNELLDTVWADVFVTENTLEPAIGAIRKAIDDGAAAQRIVSGRGSSWQHLVSSLFALWWSPGW